MSTATHEQPPDQEYLVADDDGDEDYVDYRPEMSYVQPEEVKATLQRNWDEFRRSMLTHQWDEESLLEGVEKSYSTAQAAKFFGRSNQWLYWGLRPDPETGEHVFRYKDGSPILPERAGTNGRRRFTLPLIREIALSCYRRGQIGEAELEEIMAKILLAEFGEKAFSDTER